MTEQKNNPLHGKTLQAILEELLARYRWEGLAYHIDINCFKERRCFYGEKVYRIPTERILSSNF